VPGSRCTAATEGEKYRRLEDEKVGRWEKSEGEKLRRWEKALAGGDKAHL
jgi:hypothetical protein